MGTIPASENIFPILRMAEGAAPSTPPTGEVHLYAKSDGTLYWKDDAGNEYSADVTGHLADTTDAHDASAVSVLDTAAVFTATNVETALKELYDSIVASGSVATDVIWDAKGDVAGGTGANTADRLAVGADGTRLEALASATTGLAWKGARGVLAAANAVTSAGTSGTDQAQAFAGTDLFDSDAFHDPASNNSRLTVPTGLGGFYLIVGYGAWASNATGRRTWTIRKNGSTTVANDRRPADSVAGSIATISALAVLAATDYVELVGNQTSGGALDMAATNTFGMFRIGV